MSKPIVAGVGMIKFAKPGASRSYNEMAAEAVRNALKHSGGDRVCVRLMREADDVRISIEDNGRGFDLARALEPSGKGYSSLRDQRMSIESVGGRLEIRSSQGGGATIDAWAPVTVG